MSILKAGQILISEPFLPDPHFNRSVILITEHGLGGSFGLVLNQKTDFAVNMMMEELRHITQNVYQGGPVELQSFHFVHGYSHIVGAVAVCPGVYWGGDFEQVYKGLLDNSLDQECFKFFIGYSGWSSGQLEAELAEKSWIIGHLDARHIINIEIADDQLWKVAMRSVGGYASLLANAPKDANLN
jgi:putative transcriptional regulator